MRCPAFGGRVSIAEKAGVKELLGAKSDGSVGPVSAANCILKETLAPELRKELERTGCAFIPIPPDLVNYKRTQDITASANIDEGFAENVVLADIGAYAKRVAAGYAPLQELVKIPGLEVARYADPYAATIGNSVRYMALTPRGKALDVPGVENMFVASEKVGTNGVGEAIVIGVVAGYNAVRRAMGMDLLVLPRTTMLGDFIAYVNERWDTTEGLKSRFVSHSDPYFHRAKEMGLHTEDKSRVRSHIEESGLVNVFSSKITASSHKGSDQ
jgi:hypothetical protein